MPSLLEWFRPPPAIPLHPESEIPRLYARGRTRVFESAFIAYSTLYIVRNNLAPVQKEMGDALGYDKTMLGEILAATALAYAIGKFITGFFADQADARKFLVVSMVLTALLNIGFGASSTFHIQILLWSLNGFVQSAGHGPCIRGLAHWFSFKERGFVIGSWSTAHNVGGAAASVIAGECQQYFGWRNAFLIPAVIALLCAMYLFFRMSDTPQSEGLPPIEKFRNDYPPEETESHERQLTTREILDYILHTKALWLLAAANFFVYIARYAMIDWGPTYLKEVKHVSVMTGAWSTVVIELVGAAGNISLGWLSDRVGGRRGIIAALAMFPVVIAFAGIIAVPDSILWIDMVLFGMIGFFVYPALTLLAMMGLEVTSKKAVATAFGFIGCFGYLGRVAQGLGLGWLVQHHGWNAGLYASLICSVLALLLTSFSWNIKARG